MTFAGLGASLSRSVWAFRSCGTRRFGVVAESRPRATAQSPPSRPSAPPPSRLPRGRRSQVPRSSAPLFIVSSRSSRPLCSSFPQGRRPLCSSFPQGRRNLRVEEIGVFWSYFPSPPWEEVLSSSRCGLFPTGMGSEGAKEAKGAKAAAELGFDLVFLEFISKLYRKTLSSAIEILNSSL